MEIFGIALVILAAVLYFLPALIADRRKAGNSTSIGWINLLFGWTVLGWIAALIWAVTDAPKAAVIVQRVDPHMRECTACRSMIHPQATICPHCRTAVEFLPHESGRMLSGS